MVEDIFQIQIKSLILPLIVSNNYKVLQIQHNLIEQGILVGAIRQPTVKKALLRVILKLDIKVSKMKYLLKQINVSL